jgi:hypothetical protein
VQDYVIQYIKDFFSGFGDYLDDKAKDMAVAFLEWRSEGIPQFSYDENGNPYLTPEEAEKLIYMLPVAGLEVQEEKILASIIGKGTVKYGPMNKGPLPDAIAKTFRSNTYIKLVTQEEITLYRVYGGKAGEMSSFWTRTKPQGPLQATIDNALDQNWGNTATNISTIKVPKGTTIYDGFAAGQRGLVGWWRQSSIY